MRKVGLVVGCSFGVLLLAGCPPTYPNCKSDEHCADHGEVCVQGQCQECGTDANCKPGFVCQGGKCTPKPECTPTGNECGPGKKCEAGKCVVHECDTSADCHGAGHCENHRCVAGCTADEDCPSGQKCEAGQCVAAQAGTACNWEPVHFAFNEAGLTPEAQAQLDTLAECIKRDNLSVTLEGHADERGTEEYNLQLSNRRAASVKDYLVRLGVPSSKLDTVGYGENRPVNPAQNEEAWAENRRVEFRK
ncbi:MAG: OmpA family protein [Myxococcaceae bacterium]|nr:OmpA family protein [Myxococcaceae bacterium]